MMKKYLLTTLSLIAFLSLSFGQVTYEDFESGLTLNWQPFGDGVFNGVVENPADQDPLGINPSTMVGSYTKSDMHPFSLLIAQLDEPIDLSSNNQFHIQVNAPVATQLLFKLEGTGETIERTVNIGQINTWIDYTFDFSDAAGFTTIDKIILFFDPGVEESGDTYLFDNIRATPAGECAGTVADPLIVDDFECQRNGTVIIPGLLELSPLANPDPSGINTSSTVGRYVDVGGAFQALVYDWNSPEQFPLGEGASVVNIKVWAPKTGNLLTKLEGGMSPPVEIGTMVEETETWVEYSIDFSDQIGASHEKLVFFFNAGVDPEEGDIYFIDDIRFSAPPEAPALEDFEPQKLAWEPLGSEAVFGTFDGQIANPDPSAPNESANVGAYTKGSSAFGGLRAQLPLNFTIADFPQLNLDVWAPAGVSNVTMKLFSPTQGLQEVTLELAGNESWETLNFNFEEFQTISDFERVEIQFGAVAMSGTWYFDNLTQGQSTVDPCADVEPILRIADDFDCQRNATIISGADALETLANPVPGGLNQDPLDQVGQYTDPFDDWSALVYEFDGPVDLSIFNQLSALIYSPAEVPLLFKLEGGASDPVEFSADVTTVNEWVRYEVDFSESVGTDHNRLAIFFNAGNTQAEQLTYFIDDIEWKRAPFTACVVDFETPEFSLTSWNYFANGAIEGTPFMTTANPDPDGVNSSATVGVFQEDPMGEVFAGMFASPDAPIALPTDNKTMTMKVWMDHVGQVVFKLEAGLDGAPNIGDVIAEYTTPNEWADLTFDFSATPDGAQYAVTTIIIGFDSTPEEVRTSYFDDISVAGASCGVVNVFTPQQVDQLKIMPNPATDWLRVENPGTVQTFRVMNVLGQPLQTIQILGAPSHTAIDLSELDAGMYLLSGYDADGQLVANAKFIKQ